MKNVIEKHSQVAESIRNFTLGCCFIAFALTSHFSNAEADIPIRGTWMLEDADPPEQTLDDPVKHQTEVKSLENLTARNSLENALNSLTSSMRLADLALLVDIANAIHRRSLEEQ